MNRNKSNDGKFDELRQLAEQELEKLVEVYQETATEDIQHLIHELQVHQVELEMQNGELRQAQLELQESRQKYFNLFELAPVGYFTIDKNGLILEVNLTGANLLGLEKQELIETKFSRYIEFDYQDVFYFHRRTLFEERTPQNCELKMVKEGGAQFYAQLESLVTQDSGDNVNQFRTAIIDISEGKHAQEELKRYREQLEEIVEERTAELKKANERLQLEIEERKQAEEKVLTYQKQLRTLAAESSLAEERERRHIAMKLHDDIGQNLAISNIKLGELRGFASDTDILEEIDRIREFIKQAIQRTRSLTSELSPPLLYEFGLVPALECLIKHIQEQSGVNFDFIDDEQPKPIDDEVRIILFKVVRELLVNIVKHSQASNAKISIRNEKDKLRVSVEDDGIGFDTAKIDPYLGENIGFGIFNIREQLDILGGQFEIKSEPGYGTQVTFWAPLK